MSESTNKAEQRESGFYWVKKYNKWIGAQYFANNNPPFWCFSGDRTASDETFDEIDERPIQRHQPEILAECLEALYDMCTIADIDGWQKSIDGRQLVLQKAESCISKLKSLI